MGTGLDGGQLVGLGTVSRSAETRHLAVAPIKQPDLVGWKEQMDAMKVRDEGSSAILLQRTEFHARLDGENI